jgi:ketosteroid isomerase-like protein
VSDADVIGELLADWKRGDFTTGTRLFAKDLRFTATQPEGQIEETGPDGVARFMRRFLPEWDLYTVELQELEDFGEGRFLATAFQHGTGKGSGMDITAPVSIAIRMRDGKMTQLEFHMPSRENALAALGVSADP